MKIAGVLVDILAQLGPETCGPDIVLENGKKVLHVRVIKAIHSMLVASLCWYKSSVVTWNQLDSSSTLMIHALLIAKYVENNIL